MPDLPKKKGRPLGAISIALALACAALACPRVTPALAATEAQTRAAARAYVRDLDRMKFELLHAGARAERAEFERWNRARGKAARGAKARAIREREWPGAEFRPPRGRRARGAGLRPPRELEEAGAAERRARASRVPARDRPGFLAGGPNVRANDRSSDVSLFSTQSEVSIAARGLDRVAVWNDGEWRFENGPIGYAFSRDGGHTWTDGGAPPLSGDVLHWVSDPVIAVDEKSGAFYLAAMSIASSRGPQGQGLLASAVAVARGAFSDAGFAWDAPVTARSVRDSLPDKPWIAADSASGYVYLTYTTFFQREGVQSDHIDFQRSVDGNRTWSAPRRLSSDLDEGLVQGSRPAAGLGGVVDVVWGAVDTSEGSANLDYKRLCRSRDGGVTFQPEVTVTGLYSNFGSGGPGFNRGNGFDFPGIAVDRSEGPHRGRVYVIWQEGLDYYDDYPAGDHPALEVEGRGPTPFTIGDLVRGTFDSGGDVDAFSFHAEAGQSLVFYVDSLDARIDLALRLLCADGLTSLAYNAPTWRGRARALVMTVAETGEYRVNLALNGTATGGYRMKTGFVVRENERARDHRDVFVTHSDDGVLWSEPRRVNDDPPRFDDWLPEVAVSARGEVYAVWYDWSESPPEACGGWSRVHLARSDDGGDSWVPLGAMSDAFTPWSQVGFNLSPNQGDYITLVADHLSVEAMWADGRDGDVDVYTATRDLALDPGPVPPGSPPRLARVHPNPASGVIEMELALGREGPATVDLLDPSGRRWSRLTTDVTGVGRHRLRFDLDPRIPAGVYFLRVTQLDRAAVARIAIVR